MFLSIALAVTTVLAVQQAWADDYVVGQSMVGAQSGDSHQSFDDGSIRVYGVSSGSVSYDPATATLAFRNLKAKNVAIDRGDVTVTGKATLRPGYSGDSVASGNDIGLENVGGGFVFRDCDITVSHCYCGVKACGDTRFVSGSVVVNKSEGYGILVDSAKPEPAGADMAVEGGFVSVVTPKYEGVSLAVAI